MTPHLAFPAITFAHLEAELRRELEARAGFYPGRVSKGNMLQAEADRELAAAAAWLEDVARIRDLWTAPAASPLRLSSPPGSSSRQAIAEQGAGGALSWRDRRSSLLREMGLRRRVYPEWVASGRLLEHQAAHRLACLECLLALYEDGWDWRGSDGLTPMFSALAAEEFTALRAEIDARDGRSQKELELA
jgi:hypothetical protein